MTSISQEISRSETSSLNEDSMGSDDQKLKIDTTEPPVILSCPLNITNQMEMKIETNNYEEMETDDTNSVDTNNVLYSCTTNLVEENNCNSMDMKGASSFPSEFNRDLQINNVVNHMEIAMKTE